MVNCSYLFGCSVTFDQSCGLTKTLIHAGVGWLNDGVFAMPPDLNHMSVTPLPKHHLFQCPEPSSGSSLNTKGQPAPPHYPNIKRADSGTDL
jgi:hypothetical protein